MPTVRPNWSVQTKLLVSIILLVLAGYALYRFSMAIPPLILAVILSYILTPLVNRIQRLLHLPRLITILLVYLLLLLVLAALGRLVAPLLVEQLRKLLLSAEEIVENARSIYNTPLEFAGITIDMRAQLGNLSGSLQSMMSLFRSTITALIDLVTAFAWLIFIFVISIYLIKDSAALSAWLGKLPPPDYRDDFAKLMEQIKIIWSSFLRGQILLSLIVILIITSLGFLIGLPYAMLLGILAGLLEFMPSIGHGIWLTIAGFVALIGGSTWLPLPNWAFLLLLIVVHTLFTQVDLNFLIPRIIGRSVHLSPLVVILGIVIGVFSLGVLGVVLAAPTIASLRVIGRYIYALMFDQDPFPENINWETKPTPILRWWQRRRAKTLADEPQARQSDL
jgi:predicted PurR-regulated permease PerM